MTTVLVVEDEHNIATVVRVALERDGHRVVVVARARRRSPSCRAIRAAAGRPALHSSSRMSPGSQPTVPRTVRQSRQPPSSSRISTISPLPTVSSTPS